MIDCQVVARQAEPSERACPNGLGYGRRRRAVEGIPNGRGSRQSREGRGRTSTNRKHRAAGDGEAGSANSGAGEACRGGGARDGRRRSAARSASSPHSEGHRVLGHVGTTFRTKLHVEKMLATSTSVRPTVTTKQTATRMPTAGRVVAGRRVAMPAARCVSSSPSGHVLRRPLGRTSTLSSAAGRKSGSPPGLTPSEPHDGGSPRLRAPVIPRLITPDAARSAPTCAASWCSVFCPWFHARNASAVPRHGSAVAV
jgi:hypothetical protein